MRFPLDSCDGLPINHHPGAFGFTRKHDVHTGVDLYCKPDSKVYAMEDGMVVANDIFTGQDVGTKWWNTTRYLFVIGSAGCICYGEIEPTVNIFDIVREGDVLGSVIPVLPEHKIRKDIMGHSNYMLHMELYDIIVPEPVIWNLNEEKPNHLLDVTPLLLKHAEKINIFTC